VTQASVFY